MQNDKHSDKRMGLENILISFIIIMLKYALCSETINSSIALWKLHMELYTSSCGAAIFCANGTGEMIPAGYPCCLPCSCLPTCEQQHNCCPKIGVEAENLIDSGREVVETDVTQSRRSSLGNSTKNTIRSMLQSTTKPFDFTERMKRNQEDHPEKVQLRYTNTTLTNIDAKQEQMSDAQANGVDGVEPVCFRPQVVNRPNWYLDSPAYLMVINCRYDYGDYMIKDKCESGMNKPDLAEILPVTSRRTGIAYANHFCLTCNEPDTDDDPILWEAKYVDVGRYTPVYLMFNPNEFIQLTVYNGNIHFTPVPGYHVQQCENTVFDTCNQTGLWESFDENIEQICHLGENMPILHKSMRYKNVACLHCNEDGNFDGRPLCGFWIDLDTTEENYGLTLNIRDTSIDGKTEKDLIHESYLTQAVLPLPKTKRCPTGYIALLGYCRRVICPRYQYISKGKCVPLYKHITGLGISVQIDVFTSKPIPKKFSSDSLDQLTQIYNASLTRHVTLQLRHLSVWFGPKGTKATDKYYMFDLYLFNASETIDFNVAVNEIKNFCADLGSHKALKLLDGTEIELYIKLNHRLDVRMDRSSIADKHDFVYWDKSVTAGGRLSPVIGSYFPAKPRYMRISEVNWCYRVAFAQFDDLDEVEWLGSNACRIKALNIIAFNNECDNVVTRAQTWQPYNSVYYFCMDLFKDHMYNNSADITSHMKTLPPIDDSNNDAFGNTPPVSIIIVSVLGSLILIIGAYQVVKQTRKTNIRGDERGGEKN